MVAKASMVGSLFENLPKAALRAAAPHRHSSYSSCLKPKLHPIWTEVNEFVSTNVKAIDVCPDWISFGWVVNYPPAGLWAVGNEVPDMMRDVVHKACCPSSREACIYHALFSYYAQQCPRSLEASLTQLHVLIVCALRCNTVQGVEASS